MKKKAELLYLTRQSLGSIEERFKEETDSLYKHEAELKAELLEDLKTVGLKSIKVASGDSFFISNRPGVEVKNEIAFNAWAIKEKLVKPDTERIKAFLKGLVDRKVKLPPCVEFTNRDSISIRKAAKE